MSPATPPQRRRPAGSPFVDAEPPTVETYAVDDRVTHDQAGLGRVVAVEAEGAAVLVDFGSHRLRVVTPFAKLTKL